MLELPEAIRERERFQGSERMFVLLPELGKNHGEVDYLYWTIEKE
jgi:hypothetical protein